LLRDIQTEINRIQTIAKYLFILVIYEFGTFVTFCLARRLEVFHLLTYNLKMQDRD